MTVRALVVFPVVIAAGCGRRSTPEERVRAAPAPERAAAIAEVSQARFLDDLHLIARPRPPGGAHWKVVQDHCASVLEASGFTVRSEAYDTGVNVVGERRGDTRPDEVVLLGAHYDSIAACAGADDNASGVAGVLEAARVLGRERSARTLVIACWDEEERGLVGSRAHAGALAAGGTRPRLAVVLEMIGFRSDAPDSQAVPPGFEMMFGAEVARLRENRMRGDFIALVHDDSARAAAAAITRHAAALDQPALALEIPSSAKRSPLMRDVRRSDHAPFWDLDVPAIMVTDTANFRNPNYHCGAAPDDPSDLDPAFAARVIGAVVRALRDELALDAPSR